MLVPVVRLFLFVRDDGMQLADWLAYHAGVVGPTRIHIIDHQSKESRAKEVLAKGTSCFLNPLVLARARSRL